MGVARPFSDIDLYFADVGGSAPGCIVDTQFLVAIRYEMHPFYDEAEFLFRKLAEYRTPIFATVTTRSEFLDVQRKIRTTEALMGMLAANTKWRITEQARLRLAQLKAWVDKEAKGDKMPTLTDHHIKEFKRKLFYPKTKSGKSGWLEICREFLDTKLLDDWNFLVEKLGINYLSMRSDEFKPYFTSDVTWENLCSLTERSCMGTSDAMILNMAKSSTFPFLVSADFDLAYGVMADESEKTVFVPDKLFREQVRIPQQWYRGH